MNGKIKAEGIDSEYVLNATKALEILGLDSNVPVESVEVSFKADKSGCLETHFSVTTFTGRQLDTFFQSGRGYKPSGEQMAFLIQETIKDAVTAG